MLEQRVNEFLDEAATPLTLEELVCRLTDQQDSTVGDLQPMETPIPVSRGRILAAVAVVVLAMLAGGFVITQVFDTRPPVATDDGLAGQVDESVSEGELLAATWREIPDAFHGVRPGAEAFVVDVVRTYDGAWAVGSESIEVGTGEDRAVVSQAVIWRSGDGEVWEPVNLGFGPLDDPVQGVLDFQTLTAVVTTDDGAIWAFGNRFWVDRTGEAEQSTNDLLGYRSLDGQTWEAINVPVADEAWPELVSVSVEGDVVLVVVAEMAPVDQPPGPIERTRAFASSDGQTWNQAGADEPVDLPQGSTLFGGEVVTVRGEDLSAEASAVFEIVAGPGFLLAPEATDGNTNVLDSEVNLWQSSDGNTWNALARVAPERELESHATLAAHAEGIVSVIRWEDDGDAGATMLNVDAAGSVTNLGELPVARPTEIYWIGQNLYVLAAPDDNGDPVRAPTLWVTELPRAIVPHALEPEAVQPAAPDIELSEDEVAVALQALGFYNFTEEELAEELVSDRDRMRLTEGFVAQCMAEAGFTYLPRDPEWVLQQQTGFDHQFGTREWSQSYGFGLSTLSFEQSELPPGLIGSPTPLNTPPSAEANAIETANALYLNTLDQARLAEHDERLWRADDSCEAQANVKFPEFANTDNVDFSTIDLDELRQRTLRSSVYLAVVDEVRQCVNDAGFEHGSYDEALTHMNERLVDAIEEEYIFGDVLSLTSAGFDALRGVQAEELALADAIWTCGGADRQLNEIAQPIALELLLQASR